MSTADHIWSLVARRLANEITEAELRELDDLLKKHADTDRQVKVIANWWCEDNPEDHSRRAAFIFQKIQEKIKVQENQ
jgi:NTP pyrophosphatase (non-canonical NTP hydrolase)